LWDLWASTKSFQTENVALPAEPTKSPFWIPGFFGTQHSNQIILLNGRERHRTSAGNYSKSQVQSLALITHRSIVVVENGKQWMEFYENNELAHVVNNNLYYYVFVLEVGFCA
jgi:hypothetical protein